MFFPELISSERDGPNTVLVYIEKKIDNLILFDFLDSNEFERFSRVIGLPNDWEENGSMIELVNYNGRRIQSGVIYRLNLDTLQTLDINAFVAQEDSLILAYTVNLSNITEQLFGSSVSINLMSMRRHGIRYSYTPSIEGLKRDTLSTDKVVIRKIGQGNWNELYNQDKIHTVFDSGTIYTTSRTNLIQLIGNRNQLYQQSKPMLILSHWDVDHYHFLLAFDDATIQSFSKFVFRNKVPSLTARKVMGRFADLNPTAPFPIDADVRPRYTRGPVRLNCYPINTTASLLLFNAQDNRSRNRSGIGLLLRTEKNSIIFSGDFNYDQVDIDMLPEINYIHDFHYLIVPHHGGNGGRIVYALRTLIPNKQAIISVGMNPYNPRHPYPVTTTMLNRLGFTVNRTDLRASDYTILL